MVKTVSGKEVLSKSTVKVHKRLNGGRRERALTGQVKPAAAEKSEAGGAVTNARIRVVVAGENSADLVNAVNQMNKVEILALALVLELVVQTNETDAGQGDGCHGKW